MKNSEAAVWVAVIFGVVLIILAFCCFGGLIVSESNDLDWEPIPGTTTYGWR